MRTRETIVIGVGAVVFRGDKVLLIKRGRPPFRGRWSIPGGKLHHGEALHEAVRREVREETGVEIGSLGLIDVFEALPGELAEREPRSHMLLIDFVAEWKDREPVAGDDAAEAEFVPYDEALRRLDWDKTRTALARARDIRRAASKSL